MVILKERRRLSREEVLSDDCIEKLLLENAEDDFIREAWIIREQTKLADYLTNLEKNPSLFSYEEYTENNIQYPAIQIDDIKYVFLPKSTKNRFEINTENEEKIIYCKILENNEELTFEKVLELKTHSSLLAIHNKIRQLSN